MVCSGRRTAEIVPTKSLFEPKRMTKIANILEVFDELSRASVREYPPLSVQYPLGGDSTRRGGYHRETQRGSTV